MRSSVVDGIVSVQWTPGVPLDLGAIKQAVLRWRGGVRYGGAVVTVVGVVEAAGAPGAGGSATALLRATGTHQVFRLRGWRVGQDASSLHAGEVCRVTGSVIRGGEKKQDEIWLDVQQHGPANGPNGDTEKRPPA